MKRQVKASKGNKFVRKKGYLLIARSLNFFIAMIRIVTVFVGVPTYYFLDPPKLAVYSELGLKCPAYPTLLVTGGFFIVGIYALCTAAVFNAYPFYFQRAHCFLVDR